MQRTVQKRPKMSAQKAPKTHSDLEQRKVGHIGHVRLRVSHKRDENTPYSYLLPNFSKSFKSTPLHSSSLLLYFKLPCLKCPCSSSSSKTPGRKGLMRFTTWTLQGHLRPRSAVLDESAKIILRFLSGFSGSSQAAKSQVRIGMLPIYARARAREGVKNNRRKIITKISPGEIICMQTYPTDLKIEKTRLVIILFSDPIARTRASGGNVGPLTWAFAT